MISFAIDNPVKVCVGVILTLLFGVIALNAIPVQLTPDVDRPIVTIRTGWHGRSPEEVEESILLEQEEKLKSIQGLWKMTSQAELGQGTITLEFNVGVDNARILQEVSNKLDEVRKYPLDVDRPVVDIADTAGDNAIAYLLLQAEDPNFEITQFYHYADRYLKPSLERITGVAEVGIYGGREYQVQVRFDPVALAQRKISVQELLQALRADNVSESAGDLVAGRQDVRFRVLGQYKTLEPLRKAVIRYDSSGAPIFVEDVASVTLALEKRTHLNQCKGKPSMTIYVKRETGANVLEIIEEVNKVVEELNAPGGLLKSFKDDRYGLYLRSATDDSHYIYSAVGLVVDNLILGGSLAVVVLLLFLRSPRPTLIVAVSIPISVVGTFVVMWLTGRNLNVISLAGLSFAVGMVVDNAIVVLENIDRHLGMGESPRVAALRGTKEVWGAVLSSTLTTIAVFGPVLTIQEEAGQLFRDIALAICAAVILSLVVSVSVIPAASALFLRHREDRGPVAKAAHSLFGIARFGAWMSDGFSRLIHMLTLRSVSGVLVRITVIGVIVGVSLVLTLRLVPPASYLPNGNTNFTFGRMSTPAGYSFMQNYSVGQRLEEAVKPFWSVKNTEEASKLGPITDFQTGNEYTRIPALKEFFFVVVRGYVFMIAVSEDPDNVAPIKTILKQAMDTIPGSHGMASQRSIFGRGAGNANAVNIELSCNDLDRLKTSCSALMKKLQREYTKFAVRSSPENFDEAGPERRLVVNQVRAKDLGLSVDSIATAARGMVDGSFVGDFNFEGDNIDLIVIRDPALEMTPDELPDQPVAVREKDGTTVVLPLGELVDFVDAEASQSIRRVEQQRAIAFDVSPPPNVALEEAQARIFELIAETRREGNMPDDVVVSLSGNADRLTQVRRALLGEWTGWNRESLLSVGLSRFFLALVITYLLMSALFESFVYPFVIMLSVPMATVGGFMGLAWVHAVDPTQQLDVLTMLGFIILVGIVVNNAILIVHQSLNFMRGRGEAEEDIVEPLPPREAIRESVKTRFRPIFMTTATSVCGMLPLVISPGDGSELYRGLGSVVVGGLICSTIFTLVVVPLLLSLVIDLGAGLRKLFGKKD